MTATLTTLPTELLYDITEQLDRQSLLQCALTCRLFANIVASKLWRVIPRLTPPKTVQLIHALSTSPNAGTEVLEINISGSGAFQHQSKPSTPPPHVPPTYYETIARGLGGLFQFSKSQTSTPTVSTAGASELSFQTFSTAFRKMIHLRKLVIHGPVRPRLWGFTLFIPTLREVFVYRQAESIELLNWIKGQSNLTRLRLWAPQDWPDRGSFLFNNRTVWFPQLQSLTTTPRGAAILLQCSSVSDLIIENIANIARGQTINIHALAKTIVQKNISRMLKRLTLVGHTDDVLNLLALLQGHLSYLHSLRIVFSDHIHGTSDFPSSVYTRSVVSFLKTTPKLERFEFWIGCHSPHFPDPEIRVPNCGLIMRNEGVLVHEWAKICPRLVVVRFPTNTKWLVDRFEGGPVPRLEYPAWESVL